METFVEETHTTYVNSEGVPYCQKEGEEPHLYFAFSSNLGEGEREFTGRKVRAQTFGKRVEVAYYGEGERLDLHVDEENHAHLSGKLWLDEFPGGGSVTIDPETQKCRIGRKPKEDDSGDLVVRFACRDHKLEVTGQALVPKYNQWSHDPRNKSWQEDLPVI